jgi:multicomponent K+:H+ antiporter subunit A
VLSENLLMMVVFWEITSLSSFLLIAYKSEAHESRIAARMALAVTGGGGLALLAGIILLGQVAGSYELSQVIAAADLIKAAPALSGHPDSGAARRIHQVCAVPVPFLAAERDGRTDPGFRLSALGHHGQGRRIPAGAALPGAVRYRCCGSSASAPSAPSRFVYGAYMAMYRDDFKGLLAYSTISHLGLITLLFGLSTPMSSSPACSTSSITPSSRPRCSWRPASSTTNAARATCAASTACSNYMPMDGDARHGRRRVDGGRAAAERLPEQGNVLYRSDRTVYRLRRLAFDILPIFATIAGILAVAYSARFIHDVFFNGDPIDLPRQPHEPPRWMRVPVEILVVLCLLVGMFPAWSVGTLLASAAGATLQAPLPAYDLKIWHGFNLAHWS